MFSCQLNSIHYLEDNIQKLIHLISLSLINLLSPYLENLWCNPGMSKVWVLSCPTRLYTFTFIMWWFVLFVCFLLHPQALHNLFYMLRVDFTQLLTSILDLNLRSSSLSLPECISRFFKDTLHDEIVQYSTAGGVEEGWCRTDPISYAHHTQPVQVKPACISYYTGSCDLVSKTQRYSDSISTFLLFLGFSFSPSLCLSLHNSKSCRVF